MGQMKRLFEPIKVGNVELKNRVVMLGITTGLGEKYQVNQRLINFFGDIANGGTALVTIGSVYPADSSSPKLRYKPSALGLGIWSDEFIPGLKSLTKAIHDNGAKAACQLVLCYEWKPSKDAPLEAVGPSDGLGGPGVGQVRALKVKEIHQIIEQFGEGARRAREAGFDMVELHAGIGYFINRFLSSYSNKRTDEYGGSLEKRMRLLLEVIDCAKKKAGSDYTFTCRISGDEFMEGGNGLEEAKKIVQVLEKEGVAAVNVQAGWHESPRPLVQQWVPAGAFVYLSEEIKKVTKLPVVASYRIDDPTIAEKILAEGKADFVGMARALIADPEFPNKAREGRFAEIRHCIACCRCLDNCFDGMPVACTVNANLGLGPVKPATQSKKVFVIGGGPAGMEAARVAAMRGHKVTLCEKDLRLGGLMNLGVIFNDKLEDLIKWMNWEMKSLPIEVKLRTKITSALLENMKPDVVIVAVGGEPVIPQVPGVDGDNVLSGRDIKNLMNGIPPKKGIMWRSGSIVAKYLGGKPAIMRQLMGLRFPIKRRVAIIGGQFAGCELALTLMQKGKKVTIIEESKRLGSDIGPVNRWLELDMLKKGGVRTETLAKLKEITRKGVKVSREGGKEDFLEADTVILALGLSPNPALARELEGKAPAIYLIGDVAEGAGVRRIREAIASGYEISCKI